MLAAVLLLAAAATPERCPLAAPYDRDNPFARILRHEAPASVVAETRDMIAITPLGWDRPGHTLVIPRRAVRSLDDLTPREMAHALELARRVAAAQRRAFGNTGYVVQQNNAGGAQHVCHVHFHVIPNTPVEKVSEASVAQRDAVAARLRAAMRR